MKPFKEFVTEAVALLDGVTLSKAVDDPYGGKIRKAAPKYSGKEDTFVPAKRHDVFLRGQMIGYVTEEMAQPYKKISGSRLVRPMAERKVWRAFGDAKLSTSNSLGYYRSETFGSKELAANSLARFFEPAVKKDG